MDTKGVYRLTPRKAIAGIYETLPVTGYAELHGEFIRKSLHMLIALVPGIATVTGVVPALGVLGLGVLAYTGAEYYRLQGGSVAVVSALTVLASRPRDRGRFVVGPVTLGVGAMLALLLYPAPAAFIAIYALAFGDGVASLVGRAFGTIQISRGTTLEGSLACLLAVFAAATALTGDPAVSLTIAVAATILEALPADDMDNILLPAGVGLLATFLLAT